MAGIVGEWREVAQVQGFRAPNWGLGRTLHEHVLRRLGADGRALRSFTPSSLTTSCSADHKVGPSGYTDENLSTAQLRQPACLPSVNVGPWERAD